MRSTAPYFSQKSTNSPQKPPRFSIRAWRTLAEAAVAVELKDPRSIRSALAVIAALANWWECHPDSTGMLSAPWKYLASDAGVSESALNRRLRQLRKWGLLRIDSSGSTEKMRPMWDTREGNLTAVYQLLIPPAGSFDRPPRPLREPLETLTPPAPQRSDNAALRAGEKQREKNRNRAHGHRPARRPHDAAQEVRELVPWLGEVRLSAVRRVIHDQVSWGFGGREIADRVLAAGVQMIDGVEVVLTDYPTAPVGLLASRLKSVPFAVLDDAEVERLAALARAELDQVQVLNADADRRPKTYAERAREVDDPCPDGDPLGAKGCPFCRNNLPHPN